MKAPAPQLATSRDSQSVSGQHAPSGQTPATRQLYPLTPPTLHLGERNHPAEREADQVAARVVSNLSEHGRAAYEPA